MSLRLSQNRSLRGQQGLKHMAMALGSQLRPACKEGGLGKVLLTPGVKTTLWAQLLMLPLEKERRRRRLTNECGVC